MSSENETVNLERYSRQVLYAPVGETGQQRLLASQVVLIGCGALGSNSANLLVRAGVGKLTIVDRDFIELTNLQRQALYDEEDIRQGMPKAVAAKRKLEKINSSIQIEAVIGDVHSGNIERLIEGCDLIVDATDNFETRYLINDAAVKHRIPWVYGACVGSQGLVYPILPQETPCLRCVFDTPPAPGTSPTCDTVGILGSIVQVVSAIQVTEAIKILTGDKAALLKRMLAIDLWENSYRSFGVQDCAGEGDCPTCKQGNYEFLDARRSMQVVSLCGRNAIQVTPAGEAELDFDQLRERLSAVGEVSGNQFLLRLCVEGYQLTVFSDGRAIIQGTYDTMIARSLYAKYIGM